MSRTPPHSSRARRSTRRVSTMVGMPWASTRNSSSPISASSRPAKRSISGDVERSRSANSASLAMRSTTQTFSRMMGGAERSVIRTSVSGSGVGLSIASRSMIATSFCADAKLTLLAASYLRVTAGGSSFRSAGSPLLLTLVKSSPPYPCMEAPAKWTGMQHRDDRRRSSLAFHRSPKSTPRIVGPGLFPRGRQALYQLNYEAAYVRSIRNRHRGPWPWNPPPRIRERTG